MTQTQEQHLEAAKESTASKYGYISFDDINFYEIDALLQTTEHPYAEERIVEEMILLALTNQAKELTEKSTEEKAKAFDEGCETMRRVIHVAWGAVASNDIQENSDAIYDCPKPANPYRDKANEGNK